jgi:uncharacterized membrane protein
VHINDANNTNHGRGLGTMELLVVAAILFALQRIWTLLRRVAVLEDDVKGLKRSLFEFTNKEPTATKARVAGREIRRPEDKEIALPIAAKAAAVDKISGPKQKRAEAALAKALPPENAIQKMVAVETGSETLKDGDTSKAGVSNSQIPWSGRASASPAAPDKPAKPAKPVQSFEDALGTRWAIWVGGLAFALGGIFLLRYSIESGFFSPGLRVTLAALAGLGAVGGGEFLRRRDIKLDFAGDRAAQVPAILTAAGGVILFAAIYVAYAIYGMIGSTLAFALLAGVSLGIIALGLVHGSVLAGVGLLGSFATPALVSSQSPNVWVFFTYLGVVLAASGAFAKYRKVEWILAGALFGMGSWTLLECWHTSAGHPTATLFAIALMLGAATLFWISESEYGKGGNEKFFPELPAMTVSSALAMTFALLAAGMLAGLGYLQFDQSIRIAVLLAALILSAFAWWQDALPLGALWPSILAALCVILSVSRPELDDEYRYLTLCIPLALIVAVPAFNKALQSLRQPITGLIWSFFGCLVPLTTYGVAVLAFANLDLDWAYGLSGTALAAAFVYAGLLIARRGEHEIGLLRPSSFGIAAASVFALAAIHLLFAPAWTGIALAALAGLLAHDKVHNKHPLVPWLVVAFAISVMARFALDPSVVGYHALSTTPVLNWLLAGYGIPALVFAFAAYALRDLKVRMPCLIMQGIAVTATLAGAAVLIRHGMNNGILSSDGPLTLSEHSLYTILAFGASATLIRLDRQSPSPIFSIGSMMVSYVGIISALWNHFVMLNPLFTGEGVGNWPIFNLTAVAYLVPAVLLAWIWRSAIGKRPQHYLVTLAAATFVFVSGWLVMTMRHAFHGSIMALEGLDSYGASSALEYGAELLLYLPLFLAAAWGSLLAAKSRFTSHLAVLTPWFLGVAVASFAVVHLIFGNPFLRPQYTGASLLFNLIGLGFAVPAVLFGAWVWTTRHDAGPISVASRYASAVTAGIAAFAWLNLTIRHFYHGQDVSLYVPLTEAENYTFSVAWLITGVLILAAGVRLKSQPLRMLSAGLVVLTVVKVFLFDMSSLQGVLRAFSFMGLGLSLIGIGLFYQRVLARGAQIGAPEGKAGEAA